MTSSTSVTTPTREIIAFSLIHQSIVKKTLMDVSPCLSRRERFMVTERKVLSVVGFDVGFPLSYRLKYKRFLSFLIGSFKIFFVKHVFRHSDICGATAEFATSVCLS